MCQESFLANLARTFQRATMIRIEGRWEVIEKSRCLISSSRQLLESPPFIWDGDQPMKTAICMLAFGDPNSALDKRSHCVIQRHIHFRQFGRFCRRGPRWSFSIPRHEMRSELHLGHLISTAAVSMTNTRSRSCQRSALQIDGNAFRRRSKTRPAGFDDRQDRLHEAAAFVFAVGGSR